MASGRAAPVSQRLTAWRETPMASASCSCERPERFRRDCILSSRFIPAPSIAENAAARQRAGFTSLQTLLYTGSARTLHRGALMPHPCVRRDASMLHPCNIRVASATQPCNIRVASALHPRYIPALRPRRSGSRGRARSGYSAGARGRPQSWRAGGICRPSPCSRPRGCRPRRGRRAGCARRRGRRCP